MRTPHPTLTPQELAIMKVVWRLGQSHRPRRLRSAARDAPDRLHHRDDDDEDPGGEGVPEEDAADRAHVYRPAKPRQQVVGAMVRDFLDRVFDGASDGLLLHLAKDNKLTDKQRRIVKQLIEEIDE